MDIFELVLFKVDLPAQIHTILFEHADIQRVGVHILDSTVVEFEHVHNLALRFTTWTRSVSSNYPYALQDASDKIS
jgi:hypothetical protein